MGKLSLDTATLVATEAQKVGSHLTKEMSKVDFSKFNDLVKTAVKPNKSAE
jgi:hypothetical protein